MVEHTHSFIAVDAEGREFTVHVYARYADTSDRPGTKRQVVQMSLAMADGRSLSPVGKGVYQTSTGMQLTSDDPDAP